MDVGEVIVVRCAVVGFQHRSDAERFLGELRQRLKKFGLELHPQKTRIIEFGRTPNEKDRTPNEKDRAPNEKDRTPNEEERALTIHEFCALENMSHATYHKLKRKGLGPSEVRFPDLAFVRITAAARREWHARIEEMRKSSAAELERARRSEKSRMAARVAVKSPAHISNRKRKAKN